MPTMGTEDTKTEDPRIQKIEETQIYGVFDGPLLIYVGETADPLSRRLDYHRNEAKKGGTTPVHVYIREDVENPRQDLDIEALPYDDEQAAIDDHDGVLNAQPADETEYDGYDWTSEELDYLQEHSLKQSARELDAKYHHCRKAALKLGWIERRPIEEWTEEEIELLGTDTDKAVAERLGRTRAAVAQKRHQLGIEAAGYSRKRRHLPHGLAVLAYLDYQIHDDLTYVKIAQILSEADGIDVCASTIGKLIRGKTYTDLPREKLDQEAATIRAVLQITGVDKDPEITNSRTRDAVSHDCVREKPSSAISRMRSDA